MNELPVFERNPWYQALPERARVDLWARARPRPLAAGATLFTRGMPACGFFGVAEGALQVSGHSAEGKRIALTLLEPGNWIGEVSLLDGGVHTHDVAAHGATLLVWLPPAQGAAWLAAHPELHAHFNRLLCERLRLTYGYVEALVTLPKPALVARRLWMLVKAFGEPHAGSTQLTIRLSQEDIATLVGVSRQLVNQELQRLAGLRILDAAYGDIRVHDVEALRREAQAEP